MKRERARRMTTESQATDAAGASAAAAAREPDWSEWAGPDGELGLAILAKNKDRLESYKAQPLDVSEHANQELRLAHGGYADRQIVELTQNSADSMISRGNGSIEVVLTQDTLYFADNGSQFDEDGVTTLRHLYLSEKTGDQIGQFGVGFKSLLRVSDAIEIFSHPCSFEFDRVWSRREINQVVSDRDSERCPMMRLALPFDPKPEFLTDSTLKRLAIDYEKVIRVHLKSDEASRLSCQIDSFPSKFLLLVDHVNGIKFEDMTRDSLRTVRVERSGDELLLFRDGKRESWRRFTAQHMLTDRAIVDRGETDQSSTVDLMWVVPTTALGARGKFWKYFPTLVNSLVPGILNAPWKGEDRLNLDSGDFNNELIDEMAALIATNIGHLSTETDPARHLDALPPREEGMYTDWPKKLRRGIFRRLNQSEIVPDRDGVLRKPSDIHYPPETILPATTTSALDLYAQSPYAPPNSLHVSATSRDRWVRVEELNDPTGRRKRSGGEGARHPSFGRWLEALTSGKSGQDAVAASRDAIQVAVSLGESVRPNMRYLGQIILTRSRQWRRLDQVFLPSPNGMQDGDSDELVHVGLMDDAATLAALKDLGVEELSRKLRFRDKLNAYWNQNTDAKDLWRVLKSAVSKTDQRDVVELVKRKKDYRSKFPVRAANGRWRPLRSVIWPGKIVDADHVRVDTTFHSTEAEEEILDSLGVWDAPRGRAKIEGEPDYQAYTDELRKRYRDDIGRRVWESKLTVVDDSRVGPLIVMRSLPDAGKVQYTERLLKLDETFVKWTVKHEDSDAYRPKEYDSYSLHFLRQNGVVSDGQGGVVPLVKADKHLSALRELRKLSTWNKIKGAFRFDEPSVSTEVCEAVEPEDEELIIDAWPGLQSKLCAEDRTLEVVRCSGIAVRGVLDPKCRHFVDGRRVYVVRSDDRQELESVNFALSLKLSAADIARVLRYEDQEVEALRRQVRECATDAERLLMAVDEADLRAGLPETLVAYKERDGSRLSDIPLAEAAIATYDSGTLKHYQHQLSRLNPPNQWAGGPRTVGFVRSLGFPVDWAGTRNQRRDPFEEVDGPFTLKPLHDYYQERIAERIVDMLQPQSSVRRGMLSLPTGAGKTRVAVEGTVRAMLEHRSIKSVLWVADRDELCEQAVESWRQVWRCFGEGETQLRISRMWGGQPPPEATTHTHVIVASIQTLHAKLKSNIREYDFIKSVDLVIFDEAHRSITRSSISVQNDIGFTLRQGATEPYLMGLTATPYRGHNEDETRRLVNRYGSNRLDDDAFPDSVTDSERVVQYLQGRGILAKAKHGKPIDGVRIELNEKELAWIRDNNLLSRSAETSIARDSARTERIIDAYNEQVKSVDPDAPTIIFATSVEHAMTLAAELSGLGVVARAVSGGTDRGTRRRIVEEFKREDGDIKVLVNYGVFREGFDAPRTKVIIVARPVWSPNLYFQMIGRGLRGPENGGNSESLIINVRDNIENYERKLAFTEVDWLWD